VAACGFAEDLTKRVGPRQRLIWMSLGALCLSGTGFLVLQRTDVPPIDFALRFWPFAVLFTAFACVGAANAFNIVDGLDGLLAGIALITLAAIVWVAASVGDRTVSTVAVLLAVATLGWMPFNWPRATLFAGDGGAYAIGFLTAVLLLLLVIRRPDVSPWFGITASALPVCETLYSIWRRVRAGRSTLEPDQAHLHQLVRVQMHRVREQRASRGLGLWAADGAPSAPPVTAPNGLCSPVLWLLHGGVALAGAAVYDDTNAQLKLFGAFVLTYVLVHRLLLRARTNLAYAAAR
jgi:UDP-N-acetylmuramyl pentapeptide phosphotransferase/UDP-N-acetylglucosamine-1-phosphate transferase